MNRVRLLHRKPVFFVAHSSSGMELLKHFFDLLLHLDKTLVNVVHD